MSTEGAAASAIDGQEVDERYHRQTLISWWEQERVGRARVVVVGAGAIGNEVLKLLALVGVGHVLVFDGDRIERSNLSRSVLFRDGDEGRYKAEVAAQRMRELNPSVQVSARADNVLSAGLGVLAWADVIIGAVDNREARVFINAVAARLGRVWIDGAIEGFAGVVRAFDPGNSACYECTMNAVDRQILAERRSCAMLARNAAARGHAPTSAVAASIIGALQVQEAIKHLHGQPVLIGEGLHVDGLLAQVNRVRYPRKPSCPAHEVLPGPTRVELGAAQTTIAQLLDRAQSRLGDGAVIELSRDVATSMRCPACSWQRACGAALGTLTEADARCHHCGVHCVVDFTSSLSRVSQLDPQRTLADIGVPPFDIVVARRGLEAEEHWLLAGDAEAALMDADAGWRRWLDAEVPHAA